METPSDFRPDKKLIAVKRVFSHHELKVVVERRP
jgi:hypothetical protein